MKSIISLSNYLIIFRRERGYTLVELLVVMAIMGILAGIAYTGLQGGNRAEATRSASFDLRNAIRSAAEDALNSRLNSAGVPADHYGIQIVSSSEYQTIRIEKCQLLSQATVTSTVDLPAGIKITASPSNLKSITFRKNTATPVFWDGSGNSLAPNADGSVTLTITGTGTFTVKVYQSTGRIE